MRLPLITDEETGFKILTSALEPLNFHKYAAVTIGD